MESSTNAIVHNNEHRYVSSDLPIGSLPFLNDNNKKVFPVFYSKFWIETTGSLAKLPSFYIKVLDVQTINFIEFIPDPNIEETHNGYDKIFWGNH